LKASATLSVTCVDIPVASMLSKVLTPDNEGATRGLRFSMNQEQRRLIFDVESDSPSTSISTCLSLLQDIGLFAEIWLFTQPRKASVRGDKAR
jgi:hypothetical protein